MYILFFTCLFEVALTGLVINTNSGPIRGVPSFAKDVEAYLGIPYAEPPVGDLRFARPVPKRKWTEVYNASNLPPPCAQVKIEPYYFMPDVTNMSEDCLYLNIWAPKSKPTNGLRPVIIYFHYGSFVAGSSNIKVHDASHFASHGDIVVVTVNYRLGSLGFFLAYIEEANGNMGMFDQLMAMKWMKDNAKHFNGDSENIVLMGTSAGAFSISGHLVSPLSRNLFKRAIIQSGSMMHPFFSDDNVRLYKSSRSVAKIVGCDNRTVTLDKDPYSVVKCLKTKSTEDLIKAEKYILFSGSALFFPRMNDDFFPENSIERIREGKFGKDVDALIGIAEEEGTLMLVSGMPEYFGYYGRNASTINRIRALALLRLILLVSSQPNTSEIALYYMNQVRNRTSIEYLKMLSSIIGDFAVACNTIFLADLVSLKGNTVYFYRFGYRAASTPMAEWIGVSHMDEIQYVFGSPFHENFTVEETELSHRLIERWSSFSRTGNPNIPGHLPWPRYSYYEPLFMHFGQMEESIRFRPLERCEIWRKRFKADVNNDLVHSIRSRISY